jgi:hypothetical protein
MSPRLTNVIAASSESDPGVSRRFAGAPGWQEYISALVGIVALRLSERYLDFPRTGA